ncbi:ABC-three component system protein [Bradyrhizobium sp. USDA 336]|uniref:ABC-three component system protein n=1 Tax=Bradyrhizobium sp. USDA 336 TaxID=3156311 RepID=UPI00384EF5C5
MAFASYISCIWSDSGEAVCVLRITYLPGFAQRSKWTHEHVVLDDEVERFERRLIEEWQPLFEAMCDVHDGTSPEPALSSRKGRHSTNGSRMKLGSHSAP